MSLQLIIRALAQLLFVILLSFPTLAQQPVPPIPSTGFPELDQYRASRISIYMNDFGQLARYRAAAAALPPAAARAVFLGDSLPDYWNLPDSFPRKPYLHHRIH